MENEEWGFQVSCLKRHTVAMPFSSCCLNMDVMAGDGETLRTEVGKCDTWSEPGIVRFVWRIRYGEGEIKLKG